MEVKLSTEEIRAIAAEVIRQQGTSGSSAQAPFAAPVKRGPGRPPKSASQGTPAPAKPAKQKAPNAAATDDSGDLRSIAAAAEEAGQHPNTIRNAIISKRLKAKLVGRSYQIKQADLQKYLRSNK